MAPLINRKMKNAAAPIPIWYWQVPVFHKFVFRICLISILISLPLFASFQSDMETIAMNMAKTLKLSPQTMLSITAVPEDKTYMLSIVPIFKAIQKHLSPYVNEVRLHSFRGDEQATLRSLIRSGSSEYGPTALSERPVDSLILTGSYYLTDGVSNSINVSITIINLHSQTLFQSCEYSISKKDSPAAIRREVFSKLESKAACAEIEYRGKVIKSLNHLFNSPNNNLLAYPAQYHFDNRHSYAVGWQIDALKEVLLLKYAIHFNPRSENRIILEGTGSLVFIRDGNERQIDNIVDGEPLLPTEYLEEFDSLYYLHASPNTASSEAAFEKKVFATHREQTIRERIHETFNTFYPALFSPFNYDMLDKIFVEQSRPSILVGARRSSNPRNGREVVQYTWYSKKSWLSGLLRAHLQRERSFDVDTKVMGIFSDNLDPQRYWAIILQKWHTLDRYGKIVYEDNGFLIVNFDFQADLSLKDFRIHYRLWFYDYQYDDLELGIKRHEKLVYDINKYFVNGLGGIDNNLKNAMRTFIVDKVRFTASTFTETSADDEHSEAHAISY